MSYLFGRRNMIVGALGVALLALSSCGTPGPITTTLTDYAFKLSQPSAKNGKVTFRMTNSGSVTHEFVVVQTDLAADKLPMNADGNVDEEKLTSMGEQGDIETGKTLDLTLDLHPGRYLIICNLPGHFQKGMYTEFTATP
ncbi:MAG: sulfocyanin-like copper-binding protein [Roseiflexaceae bacterium]|nr:sulfocyanin-like copper-binding protein [Roseiflexaceae bacterium]